MANNVFANGREIACKAGSGKTICAFPDVCFTPPENPATPPGVPVPYPNTGFASDTTKGSKTVKITQKEVMLKNKSYFKTSVGDEAGCAAKKGIITSKNKGKVYFQAWSMDVKIEGANVDRHLDLTTNNHASMPGDTPTWPFTDRMAIADELDACKTQRKKVKDNCEADSKGNVKCPCGNNVGAVKRAKAMEKGTAKNAALKKSFNNYSECMRNDECQKAARCMLSEKKPSTCCPPQTPHHIVPGSQFLDTNGKKLVKSYEYNKAPCVCAEGNSQTQGSHGAIHFETATQTKNMFPPPDQPFSGDERWTVGEAETLGAKAVKKEFGCNEKCIEAQLRRKHLGMGVRKNDKIRPTAPGPKKHPTNNTTA